MDSFERVLAASRVRNVLLGPRRAEGPVHVVDHMLAVQAQEPALSRWSVGQRMNRPDEASVIESVDNAEIVRVHILRPTWHYVKGDDLRWVQALTGPRVLRSSGGWYRSHDVDDGFLGTGRAVVESSLAGGSAKTRNELRDDVAAAGLDVSGQRMAALMFDLELKTVVCSGPLRNRQHTYALVDERLPPRAPLDPGEATSRLVLRYLRGHSPSTLKDLRWWSGLTIADLRRAVEDLADLVTTETVGGVEYVWLTDEPPAEAVDDAGTFELLQVFDELFVGYSETRRLLDPDGEFGAVLPIGFTKMMHVVVEGDRLAGRWRGDRRQRALKLTFDLNRPLSKSGQASLEDAARTYGAFVGADETGVDLTASTR